MISATCIRSNSGKSTASAPRLHASVSAWFPYQVNDMPTRRKTKSLSENPGDTQRNDGGLMKNNDAPSAAAGADALLYNSVCTLGTQPRCAPRALRESGQTLTHHNKPHAR